MFLYKPLLQRIKNLILVLLPGLILMSGCKQINLTDSSPTPKENMPSWSNESAKRSIIEFIEKTSLEGSKDFIPQRDRIAVLDNDGTLWCEQPVYVQLAFAIDRVRQLAPEHPEWKKKDPFASVLKGDMHALAAGGSKSLMPIIAATHAGITAEGFEQVVRQWVDTARHRGTGRRYVDMVYQPMLELLEYLRDNGYTTYIVSGGGADFMRPWVEAKYGIPPDQVIGSTGEVTYEEVNGMPQITKIPQLNFVDDGPGKPVAIYRHIGKRPVIAVGNSDGDYEMLKYTTSSGGYPRLGVLIHHTDDGREFAYDSLSSIGRLKRVHTDALPNKWLVVDMKKDWTKVFPD